MLPSFRSLVIALVLIALFPRPVLHAAEEEADTPWRADSDTLVTRVERLAAAGDIEAARAVLGTLLKRGEARRRGLDDRGRLAVARGQLDAGRFAAALDTLRQVTWADKHPDIAAEIVSLELGIHWRAMLGSHGQPRSGLLPPRLAADSERGRRGGAWLRRKEHAAALRLVLDGGVRMVEGEGGSVDHPFSAAFKSLADYAHGRIDHAALGQALGPIAERPAAVLLAELLLHEEESEIERAAPLARELWSTHGAGDAAVIAFEALRLWQGRRARMADTLPLWRMPALEDELDRLAERYADAEQRVQERLAGDEALNRFAVTGGLQERLLAEHDQAVIEGDPNEIVLDEPPSAEAIEIDLDEATYRLLTDYDGLSLHLAAEEVPVGEPAVLRYRSVHRGVHRFALYRIDDAAVWDRLVAEADSSLLAKPERIVRRALDDVDSLGSSQEADLRFDDLAEGFYVVTAQARGCPTVPMRGFMVVDPALHVRVHDNAIDAWVVHRASGRAAAGEPVRADLTLIRHPQEAAGAAWEEHGPAWRSGFTAGYLDQDSVGFVREDQRESLAAGQAAGRAAAAADPAQTVRVSATTDAHGIARLAIPQTWQRRSWEGSVRIDRPAVRVVSEVAHGRAAAWQTKAVVWADKPFARPGETLRYRGLVRDFDGADFALHDEDLHIAIELAGVTLRDERVTLDDTGAFHGTVAIPPQAESGTLRLRIDAGYWHDLTRVEAVALPDLVWRFDGPDGHDERIAAGDDLHLRFVVQDGAMQAVQGIAVEAVVTTGGAPAGSFTAKTDLAGVAAFAIPTDAEQPATYLARLRFTWQGTTYEAVRSFRTHVLPFALDTDLITPEIHRGGLARVALRFPRDATVTVQLASEQEAIGPARHLSGGGERWVTAQLPVPEDATGIDRIVISSPRLDGSSAAREMRVRLRAKPADEHAGLSLELDRFHLDPGEEVACHIGTTRPGRDVLLQAFADDAIAHALVAADDAVVTQSLAIDPRWAPNAGLDATAWLPGRGFVSTPVQTISVRPIDRLLAVAIETDTDAWRPGDTVEARITVRDWRGDPVRAALSIGVVDERVYALAADATPDLWQYFHDHQRPVDRRTGSPLANHTPAERFWRAVVAGWRGDTSRIGGGKHRAVGAFGGRRASGRRVAVRPLTDDASDPTILWLGDLRSDADGQARIRFRLPEEDGRWRLTARANDDSARLLVGSLRHEVVARSMERLACSTLVEAQVGDVIPLHLRLSNRHDSDQRYRVRIGDGAVQTIGVTAMGTRQWSVPLTVPAPAADDLHAVDGVLMRRSRVTIDWQNAAMADDDWQTETVTVLVSEPGRIIHRQDWLRIDDDGQVRVPDLRRGDAVSLRLKAWPDASARRREDLAAARADRTTGAVHALAWLLAEEGRQRNRALRQAWQDLDERPASMLVRMEAQTRFGQAVSLGTQPDGAIGAWLVARARSLGLAVPAPRLPHRLPDDATARAAAIAAALAEGRAGAHDLWLRHKNGLLASDDAAAVALALEAAYFASDADASARLQTRLATMPWNDPLTRCLAMLHLPDAPAAARGPLTLVHNGERQELDLSTWVRWSARVADAVQIRGPSGSVLAAEVIIHRDLNDASQLAIGWYQKRDGTFMPVDADALRPDGPLVMLLRNRSERPRTVTWRVPPLLQLRRNQTNIPLQHHHGVSIELPEAVWQLPHPSQRWDAEDHRQRLLAALDQAVVQPRYQRRIARVVNLDGQTGSGTVAPLLCTTIGPKSSLAVPLSARGTGRITWPSPRGAITIAVAHGGLEDAPEQQRHPDADRIAPLIRSCDAVELRAIIADHPTSAADWQAWQVILDEDHPHTLDQLARHPHLGDRDHWSTRTLRRFIDGAPAFEAIEAGAGPDTIAPDQALATAIERASRDRRDRIRALTLAPPPVPEPRQDVPTLRDYLLRMREAGWIAFADYERWIWTQDWSLRPEAFGLAADPHLDAWVAFLRDQLGIAITIDPYLRVGPITWQQHPDRPWTLIASRSARDQLSLGAAPAHLGIAAIHGLGCLVVHRAEGLVVVPVLRKPGQALSADPHISLSFDETPLADALDQIDERLALRGLLPIERGPKLQAALASGEAPSLTLRVHDMPVAEALSWIALILDGESSQKGRHLRLELNQ